MEADIRNDIDNVFTAELQDQSQDAVSPGMLGTDVQEHEVGVLALGFHPIFCGIELQVILLLFLVVVGELKAFHVGGPGRVFFPEGMTFPGFGHQDPPQVWMAGKTDAEHIVDFPFIPVSGGPDVDDALHFRVVGVQSGFDADIGIPVERKQVVDEDEGEFGFAAIRMIGTHVDGRQIVKHPKGVYRSWFSGAGGGLSPGLSERRGSGFCPLSQPR